MRLATTVPRARPDASRPVSVSAASTHCRSHGGSSPSELRGPRPMSLVPAVMLVTTCIGVGGAVDVVLIWGGEKGQAVIGRCAFWVILAGGQRFLGKQTRRAKHWLI